MWILTYNGTVTVRQAPGKHSPGIFIAEDAEEAIPTGESSLDGMWVHCVFPDRNQSGWVKRLVLSEEKPFKDWMAKSYKVISNTVSRWMMNGDVCRNVNKGTKVFGFIGTSKWVVTNLGFIEKRLLLEVK